VKAELSARWVEGKRTDKYRSSAAGFGKEEKKVEGKN